MIIFGYFFSLVFLLIRGVVSCVLLLLKAVGHMVLLLLSAFTPKEEGQGHNKKD
jgi:cytosine/uracil/thiamine/allantoin permease